MVPAIFERGSSIIAPKVGDSLSFQNITYEVIKIHGEEDGPPKGQIDVGRRAPDDPVRGIPIGLALTIDIVVWEDLLRLSKDKNADKNT